MFYWSLGGGGWVKSRLTCGSILRLLLAVAGGIYPIFVVVIPQESGTGASGSLSKNWPKIPRHANKTSHWRQLRLLILDLWTFWMNGVHKKIRWRGLPEVSLSGKVLKTWTSAAILSWVHTAARKFDLLMNIQWSCRGLLNYISHLVLLPGGLEDKLGGPEICSSVISRSWLGGTCSLSCCHLFYISRFYMIYLVF